MSLIRLLRDAAAVIEARNTLPNAVPWGLINADTLLSQSGQALLKIYRVDTATNEVVPTTQVERYPVFVLFHQATNEEYSASGLSYSMNVAITALFNQGGDRIDVLNLQDRARGEIRWLLQGLRPTWSLPSTGLRIVYTPIQNETGHLLAGMEAQVLLQPLRPAEYL